MKDKLNIGIFVSLLSIFFLLVIFFPADQKTIEVENRNLAKFPSFSSDALMSGKYAGSLEEYLSDNIGFRTYLVSASNAITGLSGITLENEAKIVAVNDDRVQQTLPTPTLKPTPSPTSASVVTTTPVQESVLIPKEEEVIPIEEDEESEQPEPAADPSPQKVGSLLVFKDRLMEIFKYNAQTAKYYAEALNNYRSATPEENVKVYSILAPTAIEFTSEKYKSVSNSQREAIDFVAENFIGVISVDAYSMLKEHSGEYIYFRSDHHWTALGAYYAYLAFCDAAGLEPVTIDKYEQYEKPDFLGYLYNMSPSNSIKNNPDAIAYYELKKPLTLSNRLIYEEAEGYRIFIGGDRPIYEIKTSVGNGKTVFIIKDSYANAFVPWLAPHYENIVVIDPRSYEQSVVGELSKYEDVDLVFLNYVLSTTFSDFILRINAVK